MQIVSLDNLHQLSKPVYCKTNKKNIISLSSAELAYRVVIFNEGPPKMCIYLWSSSILYIYFCLDTTSLGCIQNHAIMNYVTKRFHN